MVKLPIDIFNLLHPVHGWNHNEPATRARGSEDARVAALTGFVEARLAARKGVVCAQEVSTPQLASLSARLGGDATVFSFRYQREPAIKKRPNIQLEDGGEHLVMVVHPSVMVGARLLLKANYPDDPGKGLLAVDLGTGFAVVNTHLTYEMPGNSNQLRQLNALVQELGLAPDTTVACGGDFNIDADSVVAGMGKEHWRAARPGPDALFTRPKGLYDGAHIDQIVVHHGTVGELQVVDSLGLSDHNLAAADVFKLKSK